jgi:hypothetical protein
MKMRASFGKVVVCALAGFCIFSLALLFAIHEDAATPANTAAGVYAQNAKTDSTPARADEKGKWLEAYGKLPMGFEENRGQTDPQVRFVSHGQGYELFLTPREAVLEMQTGKPMDFSPRNRARALREYGRALAARRAATLQVNLAGANPDAQIAGLEKLPGRTDYYIGDKPSKWTTGIPSFRRVKYTGIYPGVDLAFYGNRQQLEYDYIVAPEADPRAIALNFAGADRMDVNSQGDLVLGIGSRNVVMQRPVAYQEENGTRQVVAANYTISPDHQVRFALASYDRSRTLTIDPVLIYSTFLGGSVGGDAAYAIAVDGAGDAYLTGQTFNASFPLTTGTTIGYNTNAPNAGVANGTAFVSELDPTGTKELYFSYLGGSTGEFGFGIAVDASGLVYVTGQSFSTDFPTLNGYIDQPLASNPNGSGFLAVLNPTVNSTASLVYSTYVGGTNGDYVNAIAVDSSKNAYLTGYTNSAGINTAGALQTTLPEGPGGAGSAFFTEVATGSTGGASLVYSTYLGGTTGAGTGTDPYGDAGFGIAVTSGNAYIVGTTTSTDFPTTASAFIQQPFASAVNGTVFFSEINPTTSTLVYSTLISDPSGATSDFGSAVAVGPSNIAYATGETDTPTFYVTSAISPGATSGVAFLTLIDTTKSGTNSIPYSTTFGGTGTDVGYGIKVDSTGNAYIGGATDSIGPTSAATTFPLTTGALQTTSTNTKGVAFVTEINPGGVNTGSACSGAACLVYSTLFGGSGAGGTGFPDRAYGLALDTANNAYIGGQVGSTDFPIYPANAFQTSLTSGDLAGFEVALTLQPTVVISPLPTLNFGTVLIGQNSTMTISITNNTGVAGIPLTLGAIAGANAGDFVVIPGGAGACGATLPTNNTPCTVSIQFTPTVNGAESASIGITYAPYGISNTQTVNLAGSGTNVAFSVMPNSLTYAGQMVNTTSAPQAVTLTNNGSTSLNYSATLTDATGSYAAALSAGSPCTATSIPATTTCTYNITFTPTTATANPITATFSIAAGGVNNVVNLSGTGWQFTMLPGSLTASAAPGASPSPAPSFTLTLVGGFPGPVTLACTGSIPLGTCTVPGSASATGTVTVTLTTKASSMTPPGGMKVPPVSPWQVLFIGLGILSLIAIPFARRRGQKIGLAGALVLMIALSACSGSSGTPAGTYNLTVTGTGSGSGTGNTETQTVTIAFTVT